MNSNSPQTAKVLAYLRMHGSMTTREGRQVLEIPSICETIRQLRNRGVPIRKVWTYLEDSHGRKRRVGRYYLPAGGEK